MTSMRDMTERDEQGIETPSCPHTALTQRWDNPADVGKKELATYVCEVCGQTFNYNEAQPLMEHPNVQAVEKADEAPADSDAP